MKRYVRARSSWSKPTVWTQIPARRTPVHAPHIPMRYRKLTSPVSSVQGKPSKAANGSSAAQKPSIARVRIMGARLRTAAIRLWTNLHGFAVARYSPRRSAQNQLVLGARILRHTSAEQFQTLRKLLVNAAETSIGEDGDNIARAQLRSNQLHDSIDCGNNARPPAVLLDLRRHCCQVQALSFRDRFRFEDVCHDDFIGQRQAVRQFILQHVAPQSIRARLQNRPQTRFRIV